MSNERGLYDFAAVPPGVYTVKAELTGFKTFENKGIRVGTQQFVTMDIKLDVGQLQETITVTGEAPLIDTSNASTGGVIDSRQLETLPSGGRSAFLFAVTVPTVVASGDAQFNRQQDQTNASLLSLGGGARRANNYLVDGVPVTDLRNRASANPDHRSARRRQRAGAPVRRRDRAAPAAARSTSPPSRAATTGTAAASTRRVRSGARPTTSSRRCAASPLPDTYFHLGGGGVGGPVDQEPHVLLVRGRRLRLEHDAQRRASASRPRAKRPATSRRRSTAPGDLVVIYDPLTGDASGNGRTPFPGNVIPPNRLNPVGRERWSSYLPMPTRDVSNGSANFDSIAEIERPRDDVHRQGRSPLHRQGLVDRLLPLQQDRRAVRQLL